MRLRIRCVAPPPPPPRPGVPLINGVLPGLHDCEIFAVDAHGMEHHLEGIESVTWHVAPGEPARATVVLVGAELDAEAADVETLALCRLATCMECGAEQYTRELSPGPMLCSRCA